MLQQVREIPVADGLSPWVGVDDVALLCEQLAALSRWHAHRRTTEEIVELRGMNRELRLDLGRRQMARARQHVALLARVATQLETGERLLRHRPPRAVLVHRREWLRAKVAAELAGQGVQVVAELDDGADGVGVTIAEQPDLLLVEDALPTMSGVEVLRAVREFSPRTRLAAQVENELALPALVAAGASTVFTRRTSPTDIARELLALVHV